ncbi:hypothetical protein [Aeromicrobium terrae]|uniref:Chlorite dismutase family protein n=1 Tax=Aeromicrobium terrae TaxID=2498846 RepID=A0A5C8NKA2_9ACTN|nr:hypothetical protein [Aeromicrobium terrae]TXL61526.1 hypothetical protein FHP06_08895 [Aeromicrobium terrae]
MFTTPKSPHWSVDVYRVSDREHQQRVLATFRAECRPAVTALGTQDATSWFVMIETSSTEDRLWSRLTVMAHDAMASRSYSFGQPPLFGPVLA